MKDIFRVMKLFFKDIPVS